jgi:hypothetical protein
MGNQVLYPHMQNYADGDRHTHMGIPVCIRAGIAKIFAYGDPRLHNEILRILGATYIYTIWPHMFNLVEKIHPQPLLYGLPLLHCVD